MKQGNFAHVVYFWLKQPEHQEDRQAFEKSLSTFINNSEFIQTKHLGTPAATDRGVIDSSYTYCLLLTFENKELQDKYQVEEGHLKFIEESSKLWEKVVVYDSENILK
ncbi:Dabb family protein [Urechidicola vernalis]|uniref:Dabb family protein n=1 Tax=Urechidicola vernalis TaxID=3075600 RepID=A0ABU2Y2S7_9FLAO|nr:Dabb family protein [Urechidicola sp. P050]MDT0552002.1 Dabb family protein [Urechidicola sp. P050]